MKLNNIYLCNFAVDRIRSIQFTIQIGQICVWHAPKRFNWLAHKMRSGSERTRIHNRNHRLVSKSKQAFVLVLIRGVKSLSACCVGVISAISLCQAQFIVSCRCAAHFQVNCSREWNCCYCSSYLWQPHRPHCWVACYTARALPPAPPLRPPRHPASRSSFTTICRPWSPAAPPTTAAARNWRAWLHRDPALSTAWSASSAPAMW